MDNLPEWALVLWRRPGMFQARVWVYHDNMLQTIAQPHEPNPGSIITMEEDAAGENETPGPYTEITGAIWQWLTKDDGGPFKRREGYMYLYKLYKGQNLNELMALFDESNTGSDTEGIATDGEGKEPVELTDKLNIKF